MRITRTHSRRLITPEWKIWIIEVRKIRATVRNMKKHPPGMNEKWLRKQVAHHTLRLTDHIEREPRKYVVQ